MSKQKIICDLDGTAALMDCRIKDRDEQIKQDGSKRNAWTAFNRGIGQEPVNEPVLKLLQNMNPNYEIVYVSGRSNEFRERTYDWLIRNEFPGVGSLLLMRKEGDYRRDDIVKKELIENSNIDMSDVLFVLDDRDQVVKMWREEFNVPCFQVQPGNF